MSFLQDHLLTALVFLPLLGAAGLLAFPRHDTAGVRGFALFVTLLDLILAFWVWARFEPEAVGMQMVERAEWVSSLGIGYAVGVDGLAILLVVLTAFLAPIIVLSTYSSVERRPREFMVSLLALQTGMLGAFVAIDMFLFYVFWEVMLVPMYFLIGIWGGRRRVYATLKFFLYTFAGSLLMLVAIVYAVYASADGGELTFFFPDLAAQLADTELGGAEHWLFLAFALAFAIKVPMFPFHTWLPDAHVEAPTAGSVVLAGVLLKLGTFGFLRYAIGLFPEAAVAYLPAIGLLAVVGIVYGALVAMVQTDIKRLVAYSSVSHLGFVMLGLAAMTVTGVSGGVLQMVNHGVSTGALFLLVGVIYERRHTREMSEFGGLARVMPRYAFFFVFIALSSIGLPGLNGFVGEFMILLGTFSSQGMGIGVDTGRVVWAGIVAVEAVALIAVLLVAAALGQQRTRARIGWPTQIVGTGFFLLLALWLTAPPVGSYAGGLLVRPLAAATGRVEAFREVFATLAVIAATGVIFAAVYLLLATQKVFFGPVRHAENERLSDLSFREGAVLAPLALVALLMGVYPQPFLDAVTPTVERYTADFRASVGLPQVATRATDDAANKPALRRRPGMRLNREQIKRLIQRRMRQRLQGKQDDAPARKLMRPNRRRRGAGQRGDGAPPKRVPNRR